MISARIFFTRFVQFNFFIIAISTDSQDDYRTEGYLTPEELEYLSEMLYPAECTYLTNSLSKSIETNFIRLKKNKETTGEGFSGEKERRRCLIKLEEWNKISLKDVRAHSRIEKILHYIGRSDLAAYLSKNYNRKPFLKSSELKTQEKIPRSAF